MSTYTHFIEHTFDSCFGVAKGPGMVEVDEAIAVWTTDDGVPTRLVWRASRYRVTDTPTVWADVCAWWRPFAPNDYAIGSVPKQIGGWRFQATSDRGVSHVFDVRHDTTLGRWSLVRVFD
jgi:hypothetical protein